MTAIEEIYEAYKKSGKADPELDDMLSGFARDMGGLTIEQAVKFLGEYASSVGSSFLSEKSAASASRLNLFKIAANSSYIEQLVKSHLINISNAPDPNARDLAIEQLRKVVKDKDPIVQEGLFNALQAEAGATHIIDDIPGIDVIKNIEPGGLFQDLQKTFAKGLGSAAAGAAKRYVAGPGIDEFARVLQFAKKGDPAAQSRFVELAGTKLGLLSKDLDAARDLVERMDIYEFKNMVANAIPGNVQKQVELLENFKLNKAERLPKILEHEKGFWGAARKIFSPGATWMERLTGGGKMLGKVVETGIGVTGATAKAYLWLPKILWKFGKIGKLLAVGAGAAEIGGTVWGLKKLFGIDDSDADADAGSAAGVSSGSEGASGSSGATEASSGSLYDQVVNVLKRTYGPR